MACGCRTVAPKNASSVASSYVKTGTGLAPFTNLGSDVSTPAAFWSPSHHVLHFFPASVSIVSAWGGCFDQIHILADRQLVCVCSDADAIMLT